jgi:hypothetical protein
VLSDVFENDNVVNSNNISTKRVVSESTIRNALIIHLAPTGNINCGRVQVGEWLRFAGANLWRPAIAIAYHASRLPSPNPTFPVGMLPDGAVCLPTLLEEEFLRSGVVSCIEMKPLIRGNDLQKILDLTPGPNITIATKFLIRLQITSPELTERDALALRIVQFSDLIAAELTKHQTDHKTKRAKHDV